MFRNLVESWFSVGEALTVSCKEWLYELVTKKTALVIILLDDAWYKKLAWKKEVSIVWYNISVISVRRRLEVSYEGSGGFDFKACYKTGWLGSIPEKAGISHGFTI